MSYHGIDKLRLDEQTVEANLQKLNTWADILAEKLNYNFAHIDMPESTIYISKETEGKQDAPIISDLFRQKMYQHSATISANTTAQITGTDFGVATPYGYTPLVISRVNLYTSGLVVAGLHPTATGSSSVLDVRNTTSSSKTQNITIYILYVKSGYIS